MAPSRPHHASLAERPVRRPYPRQEPSALAVHAGICAGGRPQGRSLPRLFMGATAISVLAGALLLRLPPAPLGAAVHGVVAGLSVVLWAFGTWLIPLLLVLGAWRHLLRHVSLAYEPGMWSIVFPVGMYGVASRQLGAVLNASWLVTLGRYVAGPCGVGRGRRGDGCGVAWATRSGSRPGGPQAASSRRRADVRSRPGLRVLARAAAPPGPASTGHAPTPGAVRAQPPPASGITASTPGLPRIARVRQPRSRIVVSRRFPAG